MARFRKARRVYVKARRGIRRHKATSGIMGDVIAGGLVGIGANFVVPMVSQFIPQGLPVRNSTVVLLGGGIAAKALLHKGGKFADAAIILGSAQAASDLFAGMAGSSNAGSAAYG